jgi:hypothetical protein
MYHDSVSVGPQPVRTVRSLKADLLCSCESQSTLNVKKNESSEWATDVCIPKKVATTCVFQQECLLLTCNFNEFELKSVPFNFQQMYSLSLHLAQSTRQTAIDFLTVDSMSRSRFSVCTTGYDKLVTRLGAIETSSTYLQ